MTHPEQIGVAANGAQDAQLAQGAQGRRPDPSADYEAIDRLAADLVPALVAQLGAAGLGELEVRQAGWRLRLRMPAAAAARARADAVAASAAADADHVQLMLPDPDALPAASPDADEARATESGNGLAGTSSDDAVAPTPPAATGTVVRSPAVGFFRPKSGIAEGVTLRRGALVGSVDVLGVAHEVTAPAGGVVSALHVSPGEPVEYGQEILVIEPAPRPAAPEPAPSASAPAPDGGA